MTAREDKAANIACAAKELESFMVDWSVEDIHKEFMVFKTFSKMWLETKEVPCYIQYLLILPLLGSQRRPPPLGIFLLEAPNNNDLEQPDHVQEAVEWSFWQTSSF